MQKFRVLNTTNWTPNWRKPWRTGTHSNSVGSISPEREKFSQDKSPRCGLIAGDSVTGIQKLSKEFITNYDDGRADWAEVKSWSGPV